MTAPTPEADANDLRSRWGRGFRPGEVIFTQGEPAREAYLLQEGRVRLVKRVSGIDRGLRLLGAGDLFGESALLTGATRTSTAVAVESGTALALDLTTFHQLLAGNPAIGTRIVEQLVRRLRDAEDQIEVLMVRDGQAKVVVALLKLAHQVLGEKALGDDPVPLAISPVDLATRVGLDVETLKRNIQQLRESGYVRIVDERVEIPDVGALQELLDLLGIKQHLVGHAVE